MSSYFKVENLYYKDILKDINFNLEQGTISVLMGKNGSGKTTLLKSIFGLLEPTGFISIKDVILSQENINEKRSKMGIYLGIDSLENKSVFLNIIEPLNNLHYDEIKARKKVYELSKKLDIENLLYKEICTLSQSQKNIVSFAQSIIHDPKIILIDNLFETLDSYYKSKVVSYLNYMKKTKKSIIIFTTNNSEDLLLADNLLCIKNGKLVINGIVEDLIKEESLLTKNDIKLPFLIDLSYKLKSYDLIDRLINNDIEMVDEIWQ